MVKKGLKCTKANCALYRTCCIKDMAEFCSVYNENAANRNVMVLDMYAMRRQRGAGQEIPARAQCSAIAI